MWIARTWNRVQGARRALCGAVVLLAACGGGTNQIEPFVPRQIIVLGDETAVLDADGKRYGMNGADESNVIDCRSAPLWTQTLILGFGMTLDRCNPDSLTARGITRGAPGARARDIEAQITAQFAADAPERRDLFLLMVGMNDIIERFEAGADCGDDELEARGRLVAQQINRLIDADARVIVSTVHDLGLTPYGRARDSARLTCLTSTFNARVRVDPRQDGRFWGLVLADDLSLSMTQEPASYGLVNVDNAPCTVAPPNCTNRTLVTGADSNTHLWATDRHFGPTFNAYLASQADARVRNNPF